MSVVKTKPHIARRAVACIIDYAIIYFFSFFLIIMIGTPNGEGVYEISGVLILLPIAFWFIITVGFEAGLGGTLGNSIMGLKAIPMNGRNRKLTIGESFKRHILDQIDMSFIGLVGIIIISNTKKNQRLGDIWAKTIVVKIKTLDA